MIQTPTTTDGWRIEVTDEHSTEDTRKWTHTARHNDGRAMVLDFSPYSHVDPDVFRILIDLNFPTRRDFGLAGPLNNGIVRAMVSKGGSMTDYQKLALAVHNYDAAVAAQRPVAEACDALAIAAARCGWRGGVDMTI